MTSTERFEAQLEHWLAETAQPSIPDDLPMLLAETARMRQRPAWAFPERWIPMSELTMRSWAARTVPWPPGLILVALLALLIVGLAFVAGTAHRPLPAPFGVARNGFFVFAADGDLIALDPATGARRTIVGGPAFDDRPVFSHDGTRIAFKRTTDAGTSIAVVDDDGSDLVILKVGDVDISDHLDWSPDDQQLLVSAETVDLVPYGRVGVPARKMAIVPTDGRGEAREFDLRMSAEMATWRPPNGDTILFRGDKDYGHALYLIDPAGGEPRPITPTTGGPYDYDLLIGWSPDGRSIAFQRETGPDHMQLWILDRDTGQERPLNTHSGLAPIWSPDGTRIAYYSADDVWQPAVADVDDPTSERRLATLIPDGWTMTWTPDGQRIVLSPMAAQYLTVIDPAGGPSLTTHWEASRAPSYQRLPFEP